MKRALKVFGDPFIFTPAIQDCVSQANGGGPTVFTTPWHVDAMSRKEKRPGLGLSWGSQERNPSKFLWAFRDDLFPAHSCWLHIGSKSGLNTNETSGKLREALLAPDCRSDLVSSVPWPSPIAQSHGTMARNQHTICKRVEYGF